MKELGDLVGASYNLVDSSLSAFPKQHARLNPAS